jgi:hypothetical protein
MDRGKARGVLTIHPLHIRGPVTPDFPRALLPAGVLTPVVHPQDHRDERGAALRCQDGDFRRAETVGPLVQFLAGGIMKEGRVTLERLSLGRFAGR